MNITAIITTYNRKEKCMQLINCLREVKKDMPIVVVDSSDKSNLVLHKNKDKNLKIIKSSHKNQPYQRYVGFCYASTSWLLYLDDDMEPLNGSLDRLERVVNQYGKEYHFFAIRFDDKHHNTFLKKEEKSILTKLNKYSLVKVFRGMSGYPIMNPGEYGPNGVKGRQPQDIDETLFSGGGVFLAKKEILYKNFNMQLFDIFESRSGSGEDGILSYTASKCTKLLYIPELLFWHNDQNNSVYTNNIYNHNKIVGYSRSYLGLEYARLNSNSLLLARLSYINYSFWRIIGRTVNLIARPNYSSILQLSGYTKGVYSGSVFRFDAKLNRNKYWISEANYDLHSSD
jgi:glycosyltransferase involved in cell wall biosynthesis